MKTVRELMGLEEAEKMKGEDPCWANYEMVGMKPGKDGKPVPNCVPKGSKKKKTNEDVELEEASDTKRPPNFTQYPIDRQDYKILRRPKKPLPKSGKEWGSDAGEKKIKEETEISEAKVGDTVSFHHELKSAPGSKVKKSGTVEKVDGDVVHVKVKDKYGVKRHQVNRSDLVKEDVEDVSEVSQDTLRNYFQKSVADLSKRQIKLNTGTGDANDAKKMQDRKKGLNRASSKIAVKMEEVEDVSEMDKSASQPGRDGKVSHSTYGSRDKKGSDYFKGKEAPGKPITADQAKKDALELLKKQGVAEDIQIDELNKDTVYSYSKKADADIEKKHKSLGQLMRRGDAAGANKAARQLNNRVAGLDRAEKRLNKEEVELEEAAIKPLPRRHFFDPIGKGDHGIAYTNLANNWKVENGKVVAHTSDPQVVKGWKRDLIAKSKMQEDVELEEAEGVKKVKMTPGERAFKRKLGKKAVQEAKVETAAQVTKHFEKGQSTPSGVPKWVAEPVDNPKLADKFMKAFKKMKTSANISCKTYGTISTCEETELEEAKKKEAAPSSKSVKKGEQLSGKQEPVKLNPELQEK